MKKSTVKSIVKQYLKDNGYAGLCTPNEDCSCTVGRLGCTRFNSKNVEFMGECVPAVREKDGLHVAKTWKKK
jgi:hypothetical protein